MSWGGSWNTGIACHSGVGHCQLKNTCGFNRCQRFEPWLHSPRSFYGCNIPRDHHFRHSPFHSFGKCTFDNFGRTLEFDNVEW